MTPEQLNACPSLEEVSADAPAGPIAAVPSVAALLRQSRAHHRRKTELANRFRGKHHTPNYAQAEGAIAHALALRLQAHARDPAHTDAEWANDPVSHDELVAFYRKYPTLP